MALSETQLFEAARGSYERSRLWWAALTASPVLVIPLASFVVSHRLSSTVGLGAALALAAVAMLWRGEGFAAGLSAGLKAGVVPLVLAHAANLYGHVCTAQGCTSLCVPACSVGGVAAGLVVVLLARRSPTPWVSLGAAAVTSCLVGAFGCACVGSSGLLAMIAGTVVSLAVGRVSFARA